MSDLFEQYHSFFNHNDWMEWRATSDSAALRQSILSVVQQQGLLEPFTDCQRNPSDIKINPLNLHETISCDELNSRKRGLLMVLDEVLRRRGLRNRRKLRILSADGISRVARILRGEYAYYLGTEYLPTEDAQAQYFPIPHMDLQDIQFPAQSFDAFFSADVFEHIPDLPGALEQIYEVLAPGGVLVSSFPFSPGRLETQIKARLNSDNEIEYLTEPEFHGNPVDPESGTLVFSLPGWDLLETLKKIGFENVRYDMPVSARHGVLSDESLGPFVLVAGKPGA